jgi:hypothetical protein
MQIKYYSEVSICTILPRGTSSSSKTTCILRYYPYVFFKGLRKRMETLSHDFKMVPPEYWIEHSVLQI